MKVMALTALLVLFAVLAILGQTGSGPAALAPAPLIPMELQAEYFRADGVLARLRADLEHAQADYDAAVAAIVKACGTGFNVAPTPDRKNLMCVRVTPPPKPQQ